MSIDTGTKVTIGWKALDVRTLGLSGNNQSKLVDKTYTLEYSDGTGTSQFQKSYAVNRALTAGADTVDLNGVVADIFGSTISATRVVAWGVYNSGAASLTITTTGANGWQACMNGVTTLPAGGLCMFGSPTAWTVTAGTADLIVMGGTGTNTYDIILWVS